MFCVVVRCFDSVDRDNVIQRVRRNIKKTRAARIIRDAMMTPADAIPRDVWSVNPFGVSRSQSTRFTMMSRKEKK